MASLYVLISFVLHLPATLSFGDTSVVCPTLDLSIDFRRDDSSFWKGTVNKKHEVGGSSSIATVVTTPVKIEDKKLFCMGILEDQVILAERPVGEDYYEAYAEARGKHSEQFFCPQQIKWRLKRSDESWYPNGESSAIVGDLYTKMKSLTEEKVVCATILSKRGIVLQKSIAEPCEMPASVVQTAFSCKDPPKRKEFAKPSKVKRFTTPSGGIGGFGRIAR